LGSALVCAGSAALNHYLERDSDALMKRTRNRPLPKGVISSNSAMIFGILLVLSGVLLICLEVNLLTAFLSLLTAFLYVLVYTPMKKVNWLNTTIGAIPGAIPPMGGWSAATGNLELGAWILFLILFVWQHPHFYSIAWLFKEDYKRAGFKMLSLDDSTGQRIFRHTVLYALALIPVSVLPFLIGISGTKYLIGALALGIGLLFYSRNLQKTGSNHAAHLLLKASVLYLPALLILIVIDRSF
ncbi:MAG: protoheme IX farnesyltransferase, partial [Candidatus Omnitrophica bacterium]|nr:protoheme IX farnesyltransferase [Candidatus Omnitrophota bacterium]